MCLPLPALPWFPQIRCIDGMNRASRVCRNRMPHRGSCRNDLPGGCKNSFYWENEFLHLLISTFIIRRYFWVEKRLQRIFCDVRHKMSSTKSPGNRDFVRCIFASPTKWISASCRPAFFLCRKSAYHKGIYDIIQILSVLQKSQKSRDFLCFSLFSGGQKGNCLLLCIIHK